ncbi:MAG: hypothetical protein IT186_07250 [Acidobacteria bacterium]|nr:hypothetical protein [Acidobacteriota bacterium]
MMATRGNAGCVAACLAASLVAGVARAEGSPTRVVPIVLDVISGSAHFTTEVTFTNRGAVPVNVRLRYTASIGAREGSGTAGLSLGEGRQRTVTDILQFLRDEGLPIPKASSGQQGGTLVVTFEGASAEVVSVTARTTSPTTAPLPAGSAGLAYRGIAPEEGVRDRLTVFGLRVNPSDRSNVAVFSTSEEPVTVKLTAVSGSGGGTRVVLAEALELGPWGWAQLSFGASGLTNGWVLAERVGGSGSFSAYGVVNDNVTNDGSFIPARGGAFAPGTLYVPVLVETPAFTSELTLSNASEAAATFRLEYAEGLDPASGAGGPVTVTLGAGEQRILPNAIDFLRGAGVAVGPAGGSYAGALRVTVDGAPLHLAYAGARTSSLAASSGLVGVFTPPADPGSEASLEASVDGLRAGATSRSNLALVNVGRSGSITLEAQVYDGDAGGLLVGDPYRLTLPPLGWRQIGNVLAQRGVANGWVRVRRVEGGEPWLAYGVINDGGQPGERTGDGAVVPMSPGAVAPGDIVRGTSWGVPAGQTLTLTRDLTVKVDGNVDVAGTILVPPDVSLSLIAAEKLSITGSIQDAAVARPGPPALAPLAAPAALPLAPPPAVRGPCAPFPRSGVLLLGGGTVEIRGNVYAPTGNDLVIAQVSRSDYLTDHTGHLVLQADLRTAPGRAARGRNECGENSGAIEVGTRRARDVMNDALNRGEKDLFGGAVAWNTADLSGTWASGYGGPGFTDATGTLGVRSASYVASRGGDSGNVIVDIRHDCRIKGTTVLQSGAAGDAGDVPAADSPPGVSEGEKGWTLLVDLDGTAIPGDANLRNCDVDTGRPAELQGRLGKAPSMTGAAGSGGPGGDGGDTHVVVFGRAGTIALVSGGSGGASGLSGLSGGDGGDVSITARATATVENVTATGYASGGKGFDGCTAVPRIAGTFGGDGGRGYFVNVSPANLSVSDSANGGDGGDGLGGGAAGGDAGQLFGHAGTSGAHGRDCPEETGFSTDGMYPTGGVFILRFSGGFTFDYLQAILPPIPLPENRALAAPTIIPLENRSPSGEVQSRFFIGIDSEGLKEYGADYYSGGNVTQQIRYEPAILMPAGLSAGASGPVQTIKQTTKVFAPTPGTFTQTYTVRTTFVGVESVTVPAGAFSAQKVEQVTTPASGSPTTRPRWFVKGIGQVRDVFPGGGTTELLAFIAP